MASCNPSGRSDGNNSNNNSNQSNNNTPGGSSDSNNNASASLPPVFNANNASMGAIPEPRALNETVAPPTLFAALSLSHHSRLSRDSSDATRSSLRSSSNSLFSASSSTDNSFLQSLISSSDGGANENDVSALTTAQEVSQRLAAIDQIAASGNNARANRPGQRRRQNPNRRDGDNRHQGQDEQQPPPQ